MRITAAALQKKKNYAIKIISESDKPLTKTDVQEKISLRFGTKLSDNHIAQVFKDVKRDSHGKAAVTVDKMKAAGRNHRLHPAPKELPEAVIGIKEELLTEREMQDIANLIRKRVPGIRHFQLDVDDAGRASVSYKLSKVLEGNVRL